MKPSDTIRLATAADALAFGRLLHSFNTEFDEPTPDADVIAERAAPLIESGEVTFFSQGTDRTGSPCFASDHRSTPERSTPTSRSSTSSQSAAAMG